MIGIIAVAGRARGFSAAGTSSCTASKRESKRTVAALRRSMPSPERWGALCELVRLRDGTAREPREPQAVGESFFPVPAVPSSELRWAMIRPVTVISYLLRSHRGRQS
jgi:hypothetical protein